MIVGIMTSLSRMHKISSINQADTGVRGTGKQAGDTTRWPCVHGLTAVTGVWLRAMESYRASASGRTLFYQ